MSVVDNDSLRNALKPFCQAKSSIKIGRGGTYWSIFFAILLAVSQLNARCQQETIFFTTERCGSANVGHNKSLCLLKVGHDEALYFFEGWSYHEILIPQRLDTTKWCGSSKVGQRELLQECLLTKSIYFKTSKQTLCAICAMCVFCVFCAEKWISLEGTSFCSIFSMWWVLYLQKYIQLMIIAMPWRDSCHDDCVSIGGICSRKWSLCHAGTPSMNSCPTLMLVRDNDRYDLQESHSVYLSCGIDFSWWRYHGV